MHLKISKKRLIAGIGLTLLFSCTHYVYIYKSQWQKDKILIDGKATEWHTPLNFYDNKSKLQYTVTNDDTNLYVCIRATEQQTQMKMFAAGMEILIDTSGGLNKNQQQFPSILFPQGRKKIDENSMEESTRNQNPDAGSLKAQRLLEFNNMKLIGFKPPINDGIYPIKNNYNISVSIDSDNDRIVTYEAVIPFKTFYKNSLSSADSSKIINVSIILNALPLPDGRMEGGPPGGGSIPPGGMGGGMNNGMGKMPVGIDDGNNPGINAGMDAGKTGEMPQPFPDNNGGNISREYLSEKNIVKTKFLLAIKK
jgi:hypothetical protein